MTVGEAEKGANNGQNRVLQPGQFSKFTLFHSIPVLERPNKVGSTFQGRWFKAIVQVRVDPLRKQTIKRKNGEVYWLVPEESAMRSYAVCVYEVPYAAK